MPDTASMLSEARAHLESAHAIADSLDAAVLCDLIERALDELVLVDAVAKGIPARR